MEYIASDLQIYLLIFPPPDLFHIQNGPIVKFFKLRSQEKYLSGYAKAPEELFDECEATLQDQCDYMSSSKSLYKIGMKCINCPSKLIQCPDGNISMAKQENGLYEVGRKLKEYFKKSEYASYGKYVHSCLF